MGQSCLNCKHCYDNKHYALFDELKKDTYEYIEKANVRGEMHEWKSNINLYRVFVSYLYNAEEQGDTYRSYRT